MRDPSYPKSRKEAVVVVVQDGEEFLGVSRRDDPEAFGLPGGKVDPGETAEQAAKREFEEETGFKVKKLVPFFQRTEGKFLVTAFVGELGKRTAQRAGETGVVAWVSQETLCTGPFGEFNAEMFEELERPVSRKNPMKQPEDLPGFRFAVLQHQKAGAMKGRLVIAAYDDQEEKVLGWMAALPKSFGRHELEAIGLPKYAVAAHPEDWAWEVAKIHAWEDGWGPLMYEAMLVLLVQKGYSGWLFNDPHCTSPQARAVWRKFANRSDIEFVEFPTEGQHPRFAMRALPALLEKKHKLVKKPDTDRERKKLVTKFLKDGFKEDNSYSSFRKNPDETRELVSLLEAKYGVRLDVSHNPRNRMLTLSRIVVPPERRGGGVGTQVMEDLHRYADQRGLSIALTPSADFGGSKARLVRFYQSLGYKPNKGKNKDYSTREAMIRVPAARRNPARARHVDCEALGNLVQAVAGSNEAFTLLDAEELDSFQTGGCAVLAAAVERVFGLMQATVGSDVNDAEHIVNYCEGGFIDSDGWQTKEQLFEKLDMESSGPRRWRVRRGVAEHDFVCPRYLVEELAALLEAHVPRQNPHYEDYMPKGFVEFRKKYMKLAKNSGALANLYVQFTTHQGDVLYKNAYEFPDHSDPAGIYGYPIDYVLKYPADIWYGAGAKYLRVLRAESPYSKWLDIQNIDKYDAEKILRRMGFYEPERLLKKAKKLFKNRVGSSIQKAFFSAVQIDLDATDDANNVVLRSSKQQTDLFLKAGFETIEDTAKTNKKAVISDREPEQIIFLTRNAFSVVEIFRLSGEGARVSPVRSIDQSKRKLAALIAKGLDDKVVSTDTYDKFWTAKGRRIEVTFERPQSYYEGKKMGEKRHRENKLHTEHVTKIKVYTERGLIRLQGQGLFKDFAASIADEFNYREHEGQVDRDWEPETRELYAKKVAEHDKKARQAYQEAENTKKVEEVVQWDMPLLQQLSKEQNMPFDAAYWLADSARLLAISGLLTYLKRILSEEWYSANQTVADVRLGEIELSLDEVYPRPLFNVVDREHYNELCDLITAALEEAQAKKNSEAFWAFHLSRLVKA